MRRYAFHEPTEWFQRRCCRGKSSLTYRSEAYFKRIAAFKSHAIEHEPVVLYCSWTLLWTRAAGCLCNGHTQHHCCLTSWPKTMGLVLKWSKAHLPHLLLLREVAPQYHAITVNFKVTVGVCLFGTLNQDFALWLPWQVSTLKPELP